MRAILNPSIRSQLDWLVALSALPAATWAALVLLARERETSAPALASIDLSSLDITLGLMVVCSLGCALWLATRIARAAARTEALLVQRTTELDQGAQAQARLHDAAQRLQQLQYLASHDELTGLVNRRCFDAELRERLSSCGVAGADLTLLFIDIDGFKQVNDEHGHGLGDQLLRLFATRLRASVREVEIVARLGGDEFAVLLNHANSDQALQTADLLVDRLSRPYRIGPLMVEVSASMGLAACSESGLSAAALMEAADAAMYQAKQAGKCRHVTSGFAPL